MTGRGLLCVHAHPDDEALATGGTLARAADEGWRTAVVTCTWATGTRRAAELERSLDILGAGKPLLLGYADARYELSAPGRQRFVDAPFDEVVGKLVAHLRAFRPEVVVTYDAFGASGHVDHIHAHRAALAAVEAAAYEQLYPEAGEPHRVRRLAFVTVPRELVGPFWPGEVKPGVPAELITTTLDVRAWAERKWAAASAHESEAERGARRRGSPSSRTRYGGSGSARSGSSSATWLTIGRSRIC